jgi:N-acetylmuramic acid 6-phosphate etherase
MSSEASRGLHELPTERRNHASADIDRRTPLEIATIMNNEDRGVAEAVSAELPAIAAAIERIAERLRRPGGRLVYLGAGTSGRLGVLDASECPPTFGTPSWQVVGWIAGGPGALTEAAEEVEDSAIAGHADVQKLAIGPDDAVVGITASGRTPYVIGAIRSANERGALTIGLACNRNSELEELVDIMIAPAVGPEVIAGSTRLKAGTAQKMVLNMLSTGAMILLGKTFGNLMVDLRATNFKLRQRAVRIVGEATGLDEAEASALLRASNDETKTAILSALSGIDPETARDRLAVVGGSVRAALSEGDGRG